MPNKGFSSLLSYTTHGDLYNFRSIQLYWKQKKNVIHLQCHCLQKYLSTYINLYQLGRKGLVIISMLVNRFISPLSRNAPGQKLSLLAPLVVLGVKKIRKGQKLPSNHNTLIWQNLVLSLVILVRTKLISHSHHIQLIKPIKVE